MSLKDSYTAGVRRAIVPFAGRLVSSGRVTPNALTVGGLVLNVATVPFILTGHFVVAAIVLLLASVCDMLDGAVARLSEQVTPFGAFLDSTSDRLSEGVLLMAIGIWFAGHGHFWDLSAVFIALTMSFLVSYTRARAEALGLECKVGLASRPERVVLLMIGLLFARYHMLTVMVWVIAAATTYTVVQRILHVRRLVCGFARHSARRPARPLRPPLGPLGGHGRASPLWYTPLRSRQVPRSLRDRPRDHRRSGPAGREVEGRHTLSNPVRVAIVGVGNCASSFVQGVEFYRNAKKNDFVPGLMHPVVGGYHVRDIEFVAAIDIDVNKVGKDLSEAIFTKPNNTVKFADVPAKGVTVARGMTHDGLGKYLSQIIKKAPGRTADIVGILKETRADVVVNYLPVGSEEATKWYAEQVLTAGCAMVNCIPVFLAREPYWQKRFVEAGVPIIGDDIKSQVGATIVHRVLTRLMRERGVKLERTSQLNVGGNTDFLNMLERERLESKKISKTNAVTSQLDYDMGADNVHIGPSDYVKWLEDRKWAYIRMEGRTFGDVPLNIELKLEVVDSPNSAGIVIDAVRCAKIGLDRGLSGSLEAPSSYFMKSPPVQHPDDQCRELTEQFISGEGRGATAVCQG